MASSDGAGDTLRNRKEKSECDENFAAPEPSSEETDSTTESETMERFRREISAINVLDTGSYWFTRIVLLRALGFILATAFLVAFCQNKALLGEKGLLPANTYLMNVRKRHSGASLTDLYFKVPTLLWFVNYESNIDFWLQLIALIGLIMSAFVCVFGTANMVLLFCIWLLYHSIVNVGQRWYSFGWESQLLETCFLAIFLCPFWDLKQLPRGAPPSRLIIWGFRWLLFRIMIGAGLIKIRGDQCWRDLTCMNYHYQTQPIPNPLSYYLHQSPSLIHQTETLGNHFIELVVPLGFFLTRRIRLMSAAIQIFFQVVLILSGNLSFLNWLTIIPALAFYDDRSLSWMFSRFKVFVVRTQQLVEEERNRWIWVSYRGCINLLMFGTIAYLSLPIVANLLSSRQLMNTSFEPFRIVNTYGAFGSVTKVRHEVVFAGSVAQRGAEWKEYEFFCKPGRISKRPCVISPYHYRLDWLMWFAGFGTSQQHPWIWHVVAKLLVNDPDLKDLIAYNPFEGEDPPKWIRTMKYRYEYARIGSKAAKAGNWYKRYYEDDYMPTVSLKDIQGVLTSLGLTNSTAFMKGPNYKKV